MRWALSRVRSILTACAEGMFWSQVSAEVMQFLQSCEVNSVGWESLRLIWSLHG